MSKNTTYVQSDGTPKLYVSSRQENSRLYYTSRFDDVENGQRGKGELMLIRNTEGLTEYILEGQFIDDIYLKDGYILWENAVVGDTLTMEVILPANTPMPRPQRDGNYDIVDNQFVENTDGTGAYILYPIDVVVERYVNDILVLGTNTVGYVMESSDTALLPNIFKLRITMKSPTGNVNLVVAVCMEIYRTKSI